MSSRKRLWINFILIVLLGIAVSYIALPKKLLPSFKVFGKQFDLRLGLDLQGGSSLVYKADTSKIASGDQAAALESARNVIETRVNAFGVSEPVVQTSQVGSSWRIIVELAGIKDINQAIKMIGDTPILEFKEVADSQPQTEEQKKAQAAADAGVKTEAEKVLKEALAKNADFSALANQYSQDPSNTGTDGQKKGGDLGFAKKGTFVAEFEKVLFDELKDGQVYPKLVKTQFGYHIIKRIETKTVQEEGKDVVEVRGAHILFAVSTEQNQVNFKTTGLSGKQLKRAGVAFNQSTGEPEVTLSFDSEGTKLFAEITKRNIGKNVAIFLDGQIISNPTVNQEITGGEAVITGNFTLKEAKDLAKRLNAGALPVPVSLISQQTVGATLGNDSVARSIFAGLLGVIVVSLFMIIFYRLPGLLATIALLLYTLIVIAIFKLWPVTLTLAGIAGFILSIGIALDANILIFERTKEELHNGRPLDVAIEEGFKRAWLSIRDSNVSSIITSVILIWFGSSIVKGFAITLLIGIVVSLFSAITVTRMLLRLVTNLNFARNPKWFGLRDLFKPKD
ncbi:MAG: protein translocase subunit SecD [Candidatus Kerfeldbacteria bacterium CG08_land_8_20_14_0_20_43_14]|uniref:Protein translocase subunit SecD n=1 Tax=Candidatus Kerfeldbacteria bacterium CG08_land_8_20_14_0_20_43_14 TaxID=2014246 RepID=A0A2H0YRQ1_9BACT|nr:MAG: protein translocase subunit SecD [Candidatus Kerfeldbacteria bacterium CG08_land_8_20_14_0_20_43_14]